MHGVLLKLAAISASVAHDLLPHHQGCTQWAEQSSWLCVTARATPDASEKQTSDSQCANMCSG